MILLPGICKKEINVMEKYEFDDLKYLEIPLPEELLKLNGMVVLRE